MRSRCEEQRTQVQTSHRTSSTFWWFFTVSLFITYLLGQTLYDTLIWSSYFSWKSTLVALQVIWSDSLGGQAGHWFALQAGWSQRTFSTRNTTREGLVTFHPHGKAQQWEVKLPPRIGSHEAHSHWMGVFAFFPIWRKGNSSCLHWRLKNQRRACVKL